MADNLSQKSSKSSEKTKYSNAINRTTSETMRLGEPEKTVNHPTSLISSTPNTRKKTPSFQITSVTVGSRTSNDGGDDSADDLDESHTDDMSDVVDNSRITDIENETPSYSEDTFSKEDVFFNASTTSLGTAPVIPTSSQYGLAIVPTEAGGNIINAAVTCANTASGDVHVSVTESGNVINLVGSVKPHETEMRDVHSHHAGRNERFKVVKIESTEPFKRGRWLCMDYLDHTMVQQQPSQQAVINVVRTNDSGDNTTVGSVQYVGPDSGVVLTDGPMTFQSLDEQIITVDPSQLKSSAVSMQEQHQAMVAAHQATIANLTTGQNTTGHSNFPSVSPGQTLQQVQQPGPVPQQHVSVTSQPHQGLPQQAMQQGSIPQSLPQSMQQVVAQQQMHQQQQNQQQNLQGQSQSISAAQQVLQQQQQHPQSMSQVPVQQPMATGPPQQPQSVAQHQSLPPQQIQQVMAAANLQQMQQQQQLQQMSQKQQTFSTQQPPQQQQSLPQNVGPQQVSSQPVPQGMVPTQQPQSQHITSQTGQSQGQYYNITPSNVSQQVGNVPISQSGIQILSQQPQTSISAQTQTIQTSTPSQMPPGIVTSQPQVVTSVPMQVMSHHQIQPGGASLVSSQGQAMQQIGQPAVAQQMPSQTSQQQQQHNIQQIQQQQYAQQMQPQAPQQSMQPPQQSMQPPQQMIQQPQQAMQQPQKVMQQPQQVMPQTLQQPQQAMSQVLQQPQQAMPQVMQQPQQTLPQQGVPQVMQQSQQTIPQQVMQQHPPTMQQQTLQQPQQTMQQQKMQPQVMQQQMHHPTNLQNIQQIHVANVPNISQGQNMQQTTSSMAAMVQGQGMMPASQGQGMIAGHQMAVSGTQQVPQGQPVAPQMVPVSSSAVNISGTSMAQTFSHMPVSQTFPTQATTTVPSRTVPSGVGTGAVNVGMEGIVDQTTGLASTNAVGGDPSVTLLESLVEVTTNAEEIQQGTITSGEDAESASGTSAVAIDNKIEQAMDLVKSHLMFAVREEVEVLKEKIAELMDRINQLELENTILKAHASQETLAQLGGSTTQQSSKNQQPQQPPNGSVS